MDLSAATNRGVETDFIQKVGGHTQNAGVHLEHTQDSTYIDRFSLEIAGGTGATLLPFNFNITNLGASFNAASILQTYKLNSIELQLNFAGSELTGTAPVTTNIRGFMLYVVPYNRTEARSATKFQIFQPRFMPGCEFKYMQNWLYDFSDKTDHEQANVQPQLMKVVNNNPKYAIPAITLAGTQAGSTYSDAKLSIFSSAGPDRTEWFCFLVAVNSFIPADNTIDFYFNVIVKANITLEGLRWSVGSINPTTLTDFTYKEKDNPLDEEQSPGEKVVSDTVARDRQFRLDRTRVTTEFKRFMQRVFADDLESVSHRDRETSPSCPDSPWFRSIQEYVLSSPRT